MNVEIEEKINVRVYEGVCLFTKKNGKEKSKVSWASADILNEVFPYLGLEVWLRT